MPKVSPETLRSSFDNYLIDFFIWLSCVKLTVEADQEAYEQAQEYIEASPHGKLIFSAANHTGHPDSLYVDKAVRELFPSHVGNLIFASAKDTWDNPWKKLFAKVLIGEMFLFDRSPEGQKAADAQNIALVERMMIDPQSPRLSPVIYPQGTRQLGAPIQSLPVTIAEKSQVPIAVLNITGAEQVMPKVDSDQKLAQLRAALQRRLRSRPEESAHVTITLSGFIDPRNKTRGAIKKAFLAAHADMNTTLQRS